MLRRIDPLVVSVALNLVAVALLSLYMVDSLVRAVLARNWLALAIDLVAWPIVALVLMKLSYDCGRRRARRQLRGRVPEIHQTGPTELTIVFGPPGQQDIVRLNLRADDPEGERQAVVEVDSWLAEHRN